jgi:aspartate/methionine/tyrosine aminotransferase
MRWAKELALGEPKHNLATSGIYGLCTDEELRPLIIDLPLGSVHSDGLPALKEAIGARYRVSPERVLTAEGASLANFLILAASVRPGDPVLLEDPFYEPLGSVLESLDARITLVSVDRSGGHSAIVEKLRSRRLGRWCAAVVTNPHNPGGVALGDDLLGEMARACEQQDAVLLVDEAYRELLLEDPPGCAAHCGETVVSTSSLTKSFGLGALRIGWAIGPEELIARAIRIHDNLGVHHPTMIEALGARILSDSKRIASWRDRIRSRTESNREVLARFLDEEPRLVGGMPPHGILAFPAWRGETPTSDVDALCRRARREAGLALVPGRFFRRPDRLRLGIGGPRGQVAPALAAFKEFLAS